MLLSALSVLVVAQSSSEIPEGLMNNPVYKLKVSVWHYECCMLCVKCIHTSLLSSCTTPLFIQVQAWNERTNKHTNKQQSSDAHQSRNTHWDFDVSNRNIRADHTSATDIRSPNHNAMKCYCKHKRVGYFRLSSSPSTLVLPNIFPQKYNMSTAKTETVSDFPIRHRLYNMGG